MTGRPEDDKFRGVAYYGVCPHPRVDGFTGGGGRQVHSGPFVRASSSSLATHRAHYIRIPVCFLPIIPIRWNVGSRGFIEVLIALHFSGLHVHVAHT